MAQTHVDSRIGRAEADLKEKQERRDALENRLAELKAELVEVVGYLDLVDASSDTENVASVHVANHQ